jgi:hypothetical protein
LEVVRTSGLCRLRREPLRVTGRDLQHKSKDEENKEPKNKNDTYDCGPKGFLPPVTQECPCLLFTDVPAISSVDCPQRLGSLLQFFVRVHMASLAKSATSTQNSAFKAECYCSSYPRHPCRSTRPFCSPSGPGRRNHSFSNTPECTAFQIGQITSTYLPDACGDSSPGSRHRCSHSRCQYGVGQPNTRNRIYRSRCTASRSSDTRHAALKAFA